MADIDTARGGTSADGRITSKAGTLESGPALSIIYMSITAGGKAGDQPSHQLLPAHSQARMTDVSALAVMPVQLVLT